MFDLQALKTAWSHPTHDAAAVIRSLIDRCVNAEAALNGTDSFNAGARGEAAMWEAKAYELQKALAALQAEEGRRSARIIDFCVAAAPLLGLDATDWHNAQFDPILSALQEKLGKS